MRLKLIENGADSCYSSVLFGHVSNVTPLSVIKTISDLPLKILEVNFNMRILAPNNLIVFLNLFLCHTEHGDIWIFVFLSVQQQRPPDLPRDYNVPFVTLPIFALSSNFLKPLQVFHLKMLLLYINEEVKLSRWHGLKLKLPQHHIS